MNIQWRYKRLMAKFPKEVTPGPDLICDAFVLECQIRKYFRYISYISNCRARAGRKSFSLEIEKVYVHFAKRFSFERP